MPARKNDLTPEEQAKLKEAGAKLRQLRKERVLTGEQVEDMTGHAISKQQISYLELGRIERPSMSLLVAVGKVYNKTPDEMAEMYGYWDSKNRPEPGTDTTLIMLLKDIEARIPPEKYEAWVRNVLNVAVITEVFQKVVTP